MPHPPPTALPDELQEAAGRRGTAALALLAFPSPAQANHSWGGYHRARTANPFN